MIDSLANLPDFPLLQQLARALWRNGTARGAAVLVGAGFSTHAECAAPDTPKPPLWPELINAMGVANKTVSDWMNDATTDPLPEVRFLVDEMNDPIDVDG